MSEVRELTLDLPANHGAVVLARRVVRHFARLGGVGDMGLEILLLVSSELLANAVDHGGGEGEMQGDSGARMRMGLRLDGTGWTFRVSDEGGGDPAAVRRLIAPDGPPDHEDERGRGFVLVAQMVDRLDVEKSADGRGLTFTAARAEARA
jgi:anti-sigma regulatory factor (Ser/Thr protein kinase)